MSPVFFFNDTATTEIYTLSLHDALPIYVLELVNFFEQQNTKYEVDSGHTAKKPDTEKRDRKSTRLNSSHQIISYAVFCLKKKHITNPPNSLSTTAQTIACNSEHATSTRD